MPHPHACRQQQSQMKGLPTGCRITPLVPGEVWEKGDSTLLPGVSVITSDGGVSKIDSWK